MEREPKVMEGSAAGPKIKGTGYTVRAPEGWGPRKVRIPGYGDADTHVFDLADRKGFVANFSVLIAPPDAYDEDRMDSAALNEMGIMGATKRRVRPPVLMAGEPATHVSGRMAKNGVQYVVEQYHAVQDEGAYVVTFSFDVGLGRVQRVEMAESVLNTWEWTE